MGKCARCLKANSRAMLLDTVSATAVGWVCADHVPLARNCGFAVKLWPPLSGSDKCVTLPAADGSTVGYERA